MSPFFLMAMQLYALWLVKKNCQTTLILSNEVKYLGVILDKKLTWEAHLSVKVNRALKIFQQCRRVFGKTWGLKPAVVLWIYTALIIPIITYASVVWWRRSMVKSTIREL